MRRLLPPLAVLMGALAVLGFMGCSHDDDDTSTGPTALAPLSISSEGAGDALPPVSIDPIDPINLTWVEEEVDILGLDPRVIDLGLIAPGETQTLTIAITNNESSAYECPDPPVRLEEASDVWHIARQPPLTIPAEGTVTFALTCTPTRIDRAWNVVALSLHLFGEVGFGVQCGRRGPAVVYGHDVPIADGDTTPRRDDHTDFGPVTVGTIASRVFVLRNDSAYPPEPYQDDNGNGVYEPGEAFTDYDGDGAWDANTVVCGAAPIAIDGAHAGDFQIQDLAIVRADDPTQPVPWQSGDPAPVLAPGDALACTIACNPTAHALRTARVAIACTDGDDGSYDFAISATGVGPVLQIYAADGSPITRDDRQPGPATGTEFLPPCYIADGVAAGGLPFQATNAYIIRNLGSAPLVFGDQDDARAIRMTETGATDFHSTQPFRYVYTHDGTVIGTEAATRLAPYDAETGLAMRDDGTYIRPGEARFTLVFNPGYRPPAMGQRDAPEEAKRHAVATIVSNDPGLIASGWDARLDPEPYTFTVRGTAIDPVMRVLNRQQAIDDRDYRVRAADGTVIHDIDMWGGTGVEVFHIRNIALTWPLPLRAVGEAHIDNQEVIYQIPSGHIDGTTIAVPGMQIDVLAAIDQGRTKHGLSPWWRMAKSWDASVLHRLRVGDRIYIDGRHGRSAGRITAISPDMNLIRGYDDVINPADLPPPPDMDLWKSANPASNFHEWAETWAARYDAIWPLGADWNTPCVGTISYRLDPGQTPLPTNTIAGDDLYLVDSGAAGGIDGPGAPDTEDPRDTVLLNPAVDPGAVEDRDGDGVIDAGEAAGLVLTPGAILTATWDWPQVHSHTWPIVDHARVADDLRVQVACAGRWGPAVVAPRVDLFLTAPPDDGLDQPLHTLVFEIDSRSREVLAQMRVGCRIEWDSPLDGFWPEAFDSDGDDRIDLGDWIDRNDDGVRAPDEDYDSDEDGDIDEHDMTRQFWPWSSIYEAINSWDYVGLPPFWLPGDADGSGLLDAPDLDLDGPDAVFTIASWDAATGQVVVDQDLRPYCDGVDGGPADWDGDGVADIADSPPDLAAQVYDPDIFGRMISPDRFRFVLPATCSLTYPQRLRFVKEDLRIIDQLPDILDPGRECLLRVAHTPRWSTGVDRARHLAAPFTGADTTAPPRFRDDDHDKGWDSCDLRTVAGTSDPGPAATRTHELAPGDHLVAAPGPGATAWDTGLVHHPAGNAAHAGDADPTTNSGIRGGLEHLFEINIPNGDSDTWFDWKTGPIPPHATSGWDPADGGGHPVPVAEPSAPHRYCDPRSPDYEFAILGTSRNPNLVLSAGGDDWYFTHPVQRPPPLSPNQLNWDIGRAVIGDDPTTIAYTFANHEYDYNLGGYLCSSRTPYLPSGRLRLTGPRPWHMGGLDTAAFTLTVQTEDPDPAYVLPMPAPTWPVDTGGFVSDETLGLRLEFAPKTSDQHQALLRYLLNDASCVTFTHHLMGEGLVPPPGGNG